MTRDHRRNSRQYIISTGGVNKFRLSEVEGVKAGNNARETPALMSTRSLCLPKGISAIFAETFSLYCSSSTPCYRLIFRLVFMIALAHGSVALRLTNMSSPIVADLRDELKLDCMFDMGGEQLYAVKWYKDDQEFFRYTPGGSPPTISFPVAGVHLVTSATDCGHDHCKVRLHSLTRDHSGGAYRCEISTEAPTFRLASETHNVTIAALPKGELRIEGLAPEYLEAEPINADCVSEPADPAPILSWYINGYQAPRKYVGDMTSSKTDILGLVSRSLSLRFAAERKFFHGEKLEISCRSSLPGIPVQPQTAVASSVLRSQPAQPVINNQKLHWLSSTVTSRAHKPTLHIIPLSVVRWFLYLFLGNVR